MCCWFKKIVVVSLTNQGLIFFRGVGLQSFLITEIFIHSQVINSLL
jgi:hypothetical protein